MKSSAADFSKNGLLARSATSNPPERGGIFNGGIAHAPLIHDSARSLKFNPSVERQRNLRESRKRVSALRGPLFFRESVPVDASATIRSVWLFFLDLKGAFSNLLTLLVSEKNDPTGAGGPNFLKAAEEFRPGRAAMSERLNTPEGPFLPLPTCQSDCATLRKADFTDTKVFPERAALLSDRLTCVMCNVQTRSWTIAQFNARRDCVCVSCYSDYVRITRPHFKQISPVVATTGDGAGDRGLHAPVSRRRYVLNPHVL
jgi:hypothetical protein